jgi:hypothetical protein
MKVYQQFHQVTQNYMHCKEVVSNTISKLVIEQICQVSLLLPYEHYYNDLKKRLLIKRSGFKRSGFNFSLRKIIKRSGNKRSGYNQTSSWSLV